MLESLFKKDAGLEARKTPAQTLTQTPTQDFRAIPQDSNTGVFL